MFFPELSMKTISRIRISVEAMSKVAEDIFEVADEISKGKYKDVLKGKTIVMFFSNTSIRTRVTFEKGVFLLG